MDAFAGAVKARTPAAHGRLVRFLLETELAVRVEREPLLSAMQRLAARARVGAPRRRAGSVP
jgi:hypothetical protein